MYIGRWIHIRICKTGTTTNRINTETWSKTNTFTTKTTVYATSNDTPHKKNIWYKIYASYTSSIPAHTTDIDLLIYRNIWYHAQTMKIIGIIMDYISCTYFPHIYIHCHVTVLIYYVSCSHHLHILFCFAFGHLSSSQMSVLALGVQIQEKKHVFSRTIHSRHLKYSVLILSIFTCVFKYENT